MYSIKENECGQEMLTVDAIFPPNKSNKYAK